MMSFPRPLLLLLAVAALPVPASGQKHTPRLVVFIAVDQMRPDYFTRYRDQYVGGLKRLNDQAAMYLHGEQDHAITETAPGHSTMLSGRSPSSAGIVTNLLGVTDPSAPLIGAAGPGASPRRFLGTTLVDWMIARDPATRVLSVSRKDRGAILPVGRARMPVFWLDGQNFTTSTYYADTLLTWVKQWNGRQGLAAFAGKDWTLLLPEAQYQEPDDQKWERGGTGNVFPHHFSDDPARAALELTATPFADSLTLDIALEGARREGLGQRDRPDLLSISLSATDAVGHVFGPNSREMHDHLLRLDRFLGWFLDSLSTLVPKDRIVLALTADHGVTSFPEYEAAHGQKGGRLAFTDLTGGIGAMFYQRYRVDFGFDSEEGLVFADVPALQARGVNVDSLSTALAETIRKMPGIRQVFTPAQLASAGSDLEAGRWRRSIPHGFAWLAAASASPGWVWTFNPAYTTHGTTNPDDVEVPIVFWGEGILAAQLSRTVRTVDIAPTLAAILGVRPTEAIEGVPLSEVAPGARRDP